MNYVEQFAEMIGVELGEKFNIVDDETLKNSCPYVVLNRVGIVDSTGTTVNSSTYKNIIVGVYEIQKLPWKPEYREEVWHISAKGSIFHDRFDKNSCVDLALYAIGNCFETKEEAEKNKDKIMKMQKEIKEELE